MFVKYSRILVFYIFLVLSILLFGVFLQKKIYVIISHYYFLTCVIEHKSFPIKESLLSYLSLILGLIPLYTRFVLNLSLIAINYTLNYYRELLPSNFLLIVEGRGEGNPMPDSTPSSTGNKYKCCYNSPHVFCRLILYSLYWWWNNLLC